MPNLWGSELCEELLQWRRDLDSLQFKSDVFLSVRWLETLYNYGLISLFPNPRLAVQEGQAHNLVHASNEVLRAFRAFRVKEQLSCYTWTAVCAWNSEVSSIAKSGEKLTDSSWSINSKQGLWCSTACGQRLLRKCHRITHPAMFPTLSWLVQLLLLNLPVNGIVQELPRYIWSPRTAYSIRKTTWWYRRVDFLYYRNRRDRISSGLFKKLTSSSKIGGSYWRNSGWSSTYRNDTQGWGDPVVWVLRISIRGDRWMDRLKNSKGDVQIHDGISGRDTAEFGQSWPSIPELYLISISPISGEENNSSCMISRGKLEKRGGKVHAANPALTLP